MCFGESENKRFFYSLDLVYLYVDHDVLKKVKNYLNGKDQESCLIILRISFMYFMYAILFKISQICGLFDQAFQYRTDLSMEF